VSKLAKHENAEIGFFRIALLSAHRLRNTVLDNSPLLSPLQMALSVIELFAGKMKVISARKVVKKTWK